MAFAPRVRSVSASVLAALCLASVACGPADGPVGRGRGVLVVAVDALRADHLQFLGYDRRTMPFLEEFAADGVVFDSAWSAGPGIIPAHVSLLTGCDPLIAKVPPLLRDGVRNAPLVSWKIPDEVPRVAVEFLAHGYTTAAFVDHPLIGGLRGFDQGFVDWDDFGGGPTAEAFEFGIRGVGLRFLDWAKGLEEDEDWFAYVHMNDLERIWNAPEEDLPLVFDPRPELDHVPPVGESEPIYFALPPSRWNGEERSLGELEALYDSAIIQLDRNLNRLLERLKRRVQWERTTVVVVGTFGVSFGESGLIAASGSLSDVDLHVPLIVRPAPADFPDAGRQVASPVSLIDLPPTLLALAGLHAPDGMHGISLVPAMQGSPDPPREYAFASCFIHDGFAVIGERYCFERSHPGSRGPALLSASWFGEETARRSDRRDILHDRWAGNTRGHLVGSAGEGAVRTAMRSAGEDWYSLIDRARGVLHPLPWASEPPDPIEVAELRAQGVLGIWP